MPKLKTQIGFNQIVMALLFLAAMEFWNRPFYLIAAALVVFILFCGGSIRVDKTMLPLLLLAIALVIFSPSSRDGVTGLIKPFCYLFCAVLGYNLMEDANQEKQEKQLTRIIFIMALGQFVHFLLNFGFNFNVIGERNMIDFWSKNTRSATGQATMATMMIGVTMPILFHNTKRWKKWLAVISLGFIALYNFRLAGRALFVLIAIALTTCLVFKLITEKSMNRKIQIVVIVAAVLCLAVILVVNNVFGLQDKLRETNFFNRFFGDNAYHDLDEDGRFEAKLGYLKLFFQYPLGGFHMREQVGTYAHDILLDTYDEGGILAFLGMLAFMIILIVRSWKAFTNKKIGMDTRLSLACFEVVMIVEFMIEPVLAGMQAQLMAFCVTYGALCKFTENISALPEGEILDANRAD